MSRSIFGTIIWTPPTLVGGLLRPHPDRLFGVAMLPMQSIELAIEEMHFARKELGMKGGFLRPNPYNGRMATASSRALRR